MTLQSMLERDRELVVADIQIKENQIRLARERKEEWERTEKELRQELDRLNSQLDEIDFEARSRYGRAYAERHGYAV